MAAFCPRCWKEVGEGCRVCPNCGYRFESFEKLSYEEKMIVALNHPVDEFRINAIRVLGRIGSERAVVALEELSGRESSVPILLEIVESLKQLGKKHEVALKALEKLKSHRARTVSKLAGEALRELQAHP